MMRLAALAVFVSEDAGGLPRACASPTPSRRCSRSARRITPTAGLPDEDAAKRLLYRLGPARFAAAVLIAWADSGAAPDDKSWRGARGLARTLAGAVFPLGDPTSCHSAVSKGPRSARMLRRLEAEWVAGGFALSREELLARAATLSRKSPKQDR